MALIELRGVSKDYVTDAGMVRALREVSVSIERGEFVAIVGTSGSGKSTLMNIVGCLDRPTDGAYLLSGIDVSKENNDARAMVRNRVIGFIFQGFNLLSRTTALENVELPLQYRGMDRKERRNAALTALQSVGLGERVHHTPNQLSGGQQQRVAIARALVTNPPLLLADEPTGNLDSRTSYEVLSLLQTLNRERSITIALVTHEHDIAACAQRVITMRDGRVESDIRHTPVDAAAELRKLGALPHDVGQHAKGGKQRGEEVPPVFVLDLLLRSVASLGVGALLGWLYMRWALDVRSASPRVTASFSWLFALFALVTHELVVPSRARTLFPKARSFDRVFLLSTHFFVASSAIALAFLSRGFAQRILSAPASLLGGVALVHVALFLVRWGIDVALMRPGGRSQTAVGAK